jgi:hypothetical protein
MSNLAKASLARARKGFSNIGENLEAIGKTRFASISNSALSLKWNLAPLGVACESKDFEFDVCLEIVSIYPCTDLTLVAQRLFHGGLQV